MFAMKLAGLSVEIRNQYSETENFCKEYLTCEEPMLTLTVTEEVLKKELAIAGEEIAGSYGERLAVYRLLGERLPFYDGCIFHGATIEYGGNAYLFAAPSGTGKTTHINYWRRAFGKEVSIVNGDKPILRYLDGVLHACGTPWAGKENLHRNVCIPVGGICFLERGTEDEICSAVPSSCVTSALSQVYLPEDKQALEATLALLDRILSDIPLWRLKCTHSIHAAFVAKEAMIGK